MREVRVSPKFYKSSGFEAWKNATEAELNGTLHYADFEMKTWMHVFILVPNA